MDSSAKPQRRNPFQQANILSYLTFAWAVPILLRGSRVGLSVEDQTECLKEDRSEELGNKLEHEWFHELKTAKKNSRQPQLRNALLRCFWTPFISNGILCVVYIALKMLVAAILAQLLLQLQQLVAKTIIYTIDEQSGVLTNATLNGFSVSTSATDAVTNSTTPLNSTSPDDMTWNGIWYNVYSLGGLLVGINFVSCVLWHHLYLRQRLMGARMRIGCCSLVYRKTLRLSMRTVCATPAGHLINLISNDVSRLDYALVFAHYIWILPIHSLVTCYIVWLQVGFPALVGVLGLLVKTVPVQMALSKLTSVLRRRIAKRTDVRVGIMSELMQGIQVIKMYAWENSFERVVSDARRSEVKQLRYANYLYGFQRTTRFFIQRTTLFLTLATAVLMGQAITADFVFSVVIYYNTLQLVAAVYFPLAINLRAEALVSIARVQTFLLQEERDRALCGTQSSGEATEALVINNLSASWEKEKPQRTLQGLSMQIKKGQLCAIIGPVGSGKSSLLQLLLRELPITDGCFFMNEELSYASQEPWLFSETVRNNILFGEQFDQKRYLDVTTACALITDFQQLTDGDRTIIGDRGASLSGGQRARISLARAVYKSASIYLLDDPLSAVDAHVGRHLFDEIIGPRGRLAQQKATRVLVTHQVHFLSEADWIVIVDQGQIIAQGTYQEIVNSDLDFAKLLDVSDKTDSAELEMSSSLPLERNELENEEEEEESDGALEESLPLKMRKNSDNTHKLGHAASQEKTCEGRKALAETQATGEISADICYKYFQAGSSLLGFTFMVGVMLLSQMVCSGSDYFSNIWTQQEYLRSQSQPTKLTTTDCMSIYGVLILGVVIMSTYRGYLFLRICMHASKVLHERMFNCILHTTMRFFQNNPTGRILNRFSKDIGTMDEWLPRNMLEFIQHALVIIGTMALIIALNPMLLPAVLLVSLFNMFVLKIYLRPSQDLKRMEGICRSPVFSHLTSTLSGVSIIRSRHMQTKAVNEFDSLQDVHSGVWQLAESTNTALGLWVDAINCVFLAAVTFSFVALSGATYSGNVGLAISQAILLTGMVQYCVRQFAESLQQMTSVERVLEYTQLEQESEPSNRMQPPELWPQHGKIEFQHMNLSYDPKDSPVLRDLSLTVEPGWKVGIVGRTGAGKSSLIAALFRLAYVEGGIYIDNIETGSVPLEILRSRVSIIPQDPVLFSATIRYNLDPFGRYSDAKLWSALEDVELRNAIPGLDFMVTERGSNFSVGQRQLLCLARAILRNNRILVLDEATANVDLLTDSLIQRTIREKFQTCTVMTVAHRLHTVMDSNRIIVMDGGNAVEFDKPHILLQKPQGVLTLMVEASGSEAETLRQLARDAFQETQSRKGSDERQLLSLLKRGTDILVDK